LWPECWAPASARNSWLLLLPILGSFLPGNESIKATVLGIADELTRDGLVLRYQG
jgi:alpha,alpha-trehalase